MSQQFALPLMKKEKIAQDTWTFIFDRKGLKYNFFPGQYNDITLTLDSGEKDTRSFTVASSPLEKDVVMIATKIGESAFKHSLFHLKPGDVVACRGPLGGFYFREENKMPRVFISGGIGITPFRSMIIYMAKKGIKIPIYLFASFSRYDEVCFYDELLAVEESYPYLKTIFLLTDTKYVAKGWKGETGRISGQLFKKYHIDNSHSLFNIVGPQEMVDDARELLLHAGVVNARIQVENFTGYED